jgi:DNA-binding transcriptional ArsR family regulator
MKNDDILKLKQFIRVSQEVETILNVSELQKKILLKLVDLWGTDTRAISVGQLASSIKDVSERSVYRHLEALVSLHWISISNSKEDRRVRLVAPTPRLLKVLSIAL